ncbi:hypothetical protein HKX48_000610 [Thoreauomyces humboldtii]|nr:hypothetical protein HKX48_000610 [Thoreauomyces humboldtii]
MGSDSDSSEGDLLVTLFSDNDSLADSASEDDVQELEAQDSTSPNNSTATTTPTTTPPRRRSRNRNRSGTPITTPRLGIHPDRTNSPPPLSEGDSDDEVAGAVFKSLGTDNPRYHAFVRARRKRRIARIRERRERFQEEGRLATERRRSTNAPVVLPLFSDGEVTTHPVISDVVADATLKGIEVWLPKLGLHEFGWPKGYGLYGHRRPNSQTKSFDKWDYYLYGYPRGDRYRSPAEFQPHLSWLVEGDPYRSCGCRFCKHRPLRPERSAEFVEQVRVSRNSHPPFRSHTSNGSIGTDDGIPAVHPQARMYSSGHAGDAAQHGAILAVDRSRGPVGRTGDESGRKRKVSGHELLEEEEDQEVYVADDSERETTRKHPRVRVEDDAEDDSHGDESADSRRSMMDEEREEDSSSFVHVLTETEMQEFRAYERVRDDDHPSEIEFVDPIRVDEAEAFGSEVDDGSSAEQEYADSDVEYVSRSEDEEGPNEDSGMGGWDVEEQDDEVTSDSRQRGGWAASPTARAGDEEDHAGVGSSNAPVVFDSGQNSPRSTSIDRAPSLASTTASAAHAKARIAWIPRPGEMIWAASRCLADVPPPSVRRETTWPCLVLSQRILDHAFPDVARRFGKRRCPKHSGIWVVPLPLPKLEERKRAMVVRDDGEKGRKRTRDPRIVANPSYIRCVDMAFMPFSARDPMEEEDEEAQEQDSSENEEDASEDEEVRRSALIQASDLVGKWESFSLRDTAMGFSRRLHQRRQLNGSQSHRSELDHEEDDMPRVRVFPSLPLSPPLSSPPSPLDDPEDYDDGHESDSSTIDPTNPDHIHLHSIRVGADIIRDDDVILVAHARSPRSDRPTRAHRLLVVATVATQGIVWIVGRLMATGDGDDDEEMDRLWKVRPHHVVARCVPGFGIGKIRRGVGGTRRVRDAWEGWVDPRIL